MFLLDLYMTVNIDCFQLFVQFTIFNGPLQLKGLFLSFTKIKPFSSDAELCFVLFVFCILYFFGYDCNNSNLDLETVSAILSVLFSRTRNILSFKEQFLIK